jgi:hypothetical protein
MTQNNNLQQKKPQLNDLRINIKSEFEADIFLMNYTKMPLFIGRIDRRTDTFTSAPKDRSNLFHLFADGKRMSGLGLNTELLHKVRFTFIEIPYEGETLRTTKEHFLAKSIPSPYVSSRVDPQRILALNEFYIPEQEPNEKELSLFGSGS